MAPDREVLRLRPSPWRHLGLLLICLVFIAIGVFMIRAGKWEGWLSVGFFGLGIPIFLINLWPGASFLELTGEGMRVRTLFREWSVAWRDVSFFQVVHVGTSKLVGWNYEPTFTKQSRSRRFSKAVGGCEAGLPDTYGRRPEALAELLNDWRCRHSGAADDAFRQTVD